MFNDFEKKQKEKTFICSKLRFENIDNFLNTKILSFDKENFFYSYILTTLANFISYEEDV